MPSGIGTASTYSRDIDSEYTPRMTSHHKLHQKFKKHGSLDLPFYPREFEAIFINSTQITSETELNLSSCRVTGNCLKFVQAAANGPGSFIIVTERTEIGHKAMILAGRKRGNKNLQEDERRDLYLFLGSLAHMILFIVLSIVFMSVPSVKHTLDFEVVDKLTLGAIVRGVLCTPMQLLTIWQFYTASCKTWNCLSVDIDVLVAIKANIIYLLSLYSVIRAACYSEFQGMDFFGTSAMFMAASLLWRYLDALVQRKRFQVITDHKDTAIETITLMTLNHEGNMISKEDISGVSIHKTDVIQIIIGAKLASDHGFAKWEQSCVNENGMLGIMGKSVGSRSALSQIADLVKSNRMAQGPVMEFVDIISKFLICLGILFSLLFGIAWFLVGKFHPHPDSWLPHSMDGSRLAAQVWISIIAISSPCSLTLGTRIAAMVATQVGASEGILFNTGKALESDSKVNCVVFNSDTITDRNPVVDVAKSLNNLKLENFFELVAAMKANTDHPLAKPLIEYARKWLKDKENALPIQAHEFFSVAGCGMKAVVQGTEMFIGNERFMGENDIVIPKDAENELGEAEEIIGTKGIAKIGMLVALNREVIGVVTVSYSLIQGAEDVISILRAMNVKSLIATGMVEGKARTVKNLQEQGYIVAMVDYGANNSPELLAADVGIAVGAEADRISIAKEAADIVLTNNLKDVITALDLSNKTVNRNRLNCIFAVVHNILCIPMATAAPLLLGSPLQPWVAGTIATGSSLALFTWSYLLKFYKRPKHLKSLNLLSIRVE